MTKHVKRIIKLGKLPKQQAMSMKAVMYLVGASGFGYLLIFIFKNDDPLNIQPPSFPEETKSKNQAFVNVLKGAALNNEPLYRMNKSELSATTEKLIKKN